MTKPTVLILIGSSWPGNDSSGPNLSIRALCDSLASDFHFRIVSRDRAFGADRPVIDLTDWRDIGCAQVRYLPIGRSGAIGLTRLLRETPHDLLVLNGFFDREFTLPTLFARRLKRGSRAPILLSPRGEFTGGALGLKSQPKSLFRLVAQVTGLHKGVNFHATSAGELSDIQAVMPGYPVFLVPNFRPLFAIPSHALRLVDAPLRLAFLGRISPVKGLDAALAAVAKANVASEFNIYGPISDPVHWAHCAELISRLPAHIRVTHHGEIANDDAPAMLAAHDALLLPSLSENFGHAIFESLASGTPVIIGNQTPWTDLAAKMAGYDCPVGDIDALARAIRTFDAMTPGEASQWRQGARQMAENYTSGNESRNLMSALFHRLIERNDNERS
jgi:glycosyltransferase involved in cell wall biosynthesis